MVREDVSPLQGLESWWRDTRAFSPGYHMAGLRPFRFCGLVARAVVGESNAVIIPSTGL